LYAIFFFTLPEQQIMYVYSYVESQRTALSPLKYYPSPVQKLIYIICIVSGLAWDLPTAGLEYDNLNWLGIPLLEKPEYFKM
jgi:hypothetical protein